MKEHQFTFYEAFDGKEFLDYETCWSYEELARILANAESDNETIKFYNGYNELITYSNSWGSVIGYGFAIGVNKVVIQNEEAFKTFKRIFDGLKWNITCLYNIDSPGTWIWNKLKPDRIMDGAFKKVEN